MGHLFQKLHYWLIRQLLNLGIGVRLFALITLAACVALVLAAVGISGLADSKDSLRSVFEDRMVPVEQLADISQRMLINRLVLESALSRVDVDDSQGRGALSMDSKFAASAADTLEKNIATINTVWKHYVATALSPTERALADSYTESRSAYIREALLPAVAALRANDYARARMLSIKAAALYEQSRPQLDALNKWQFDTARQSYSTGVRRYENTRLLAITMLLGAVVTMSWLGWILSRSIVDPLRQMMVVLKRISYGRYDSEITVSGRDEVGQVMRALGEMQTKLEVDEKAIHQLAFYDPLTQLPNRRLLRDRLQSAQTISARNQLYGAVLMIDLDNFKSINDTLGHEVGDSLLVEVAQRINACVRQADTVARLGGDEFVVILVDLGSDEAHAAVQAERVGTKILTSINQPCILSQKTHRPSGSLGLSLFIGQDISMEDLLKRTDISMYQAKARGRNTLQFFDPQLQIKLESRAALESELHGALSDEQLLLFYQIQCNNFSDVLGAEVLLRWQHPVHGLVPPDQFIAIAEESGLIVPIGEWVLRTACEQLARWAANVATAELALSVNVSARQFREADFVEMVHKLLKSTGANPAMLKLELTESLVLDDVNETIDKMRTLNQLGIHFSMDDFGTGYSSLGHLTQLPIQQLKIDRSFVRNITNKHNDVVIAQTIVGMANSLGVNVIAEGVETVAQRDCLERLGCFAYQGYLFGKPMPLHEFEVLAAASHLTNAYQT